MVVALFHDDFADVICDILVSITLQVLIVFLIQLDHTARANQTHHNQRHNDQQNYPVEELEFVRQKLQLPGPISDDGHVVVVDPIAPTSECLLVLVVDMLTAPDLPDFAIELLRVTIEAHADSLIAVEKVLVIVVLESDLERSLL